MVDDVVRQLRLAQVLCRVAAGDFLPHCKTFQSGECYKHFVESAMSASTIRSRFTGKGSEAVPFLAMNQRPRGFAGAFGVLAFLPIHYPIQRVHGDSMAITLRPCDRGGCGRGSARS
jgi:hypothetical protein